MNPPQDDGGALRGRLPQSRPDEKQRPENSGRPAASIARIGLPATPLQAALRPLFAAFDAASSQLNARERDAFLSIVEIRLERAQARHADDRERAA